MFDRVTYPPRGRNGGASGMTGRLYLSDGTELKAKGRQSIPSGQRITLEMPGGGGLGDPKTRDRTSVTADVRNGMVSQEKARLVYGVEV